MAIIHSQQLLAWVAVADTCTMNFPLIRARVKRTQVEAIDVRSYELVAVDGELPAFEAGAHIDVLTPLGPRQYSLCNSAQDTGSYEIAVKKEAAGRGGSAWVHEHLKEGMSLEISVPRNNFRLVSGARFHCLLAGGIGITPLIAMAEQLWATGQPFKLVCFARSRVHLAFKERIESAPWAEYAQIQFDDSPQRHVDLKTLCSQLPTSSEVYLCGPSGFMAAARAVVESITSLKVHQEHFSSMPLRAIGAPGPYTLMLSRSGRKIEVGAGQTILQGLRAAGLDPASSCESGVCGSCVTRYLAGRPAHADQCLSEHERIDHVALCCAGSLSEKIVLDL